MRGLFRKNKKVTIILSLSMCLLIVGIGTVTSNASMNRYDDWMKKYLEYRAANKDLSNDQIAAMVDEEMNKLQQKKDVTTLNQIQNTAEQVVDATTCPSTIIETQNTLSSETITLPATTNNPTVTQMPESTTYPVITIAPSTTVEPQNTLSPGDMTKPTVTLSPETETPDAETLPATTQTPEPKEEEKSSSSPCDCEDCVAFYAIYQ